MNFLIHIVIFFTLLISPSHAMADYLEKNKVIVDLLEKYSVTTDLVEKDRVIADLVGKDREYALTFSDIPPYDRKNILKIYVEMWDEVKAKGDPNDMWIKSSKLIESDASYYNYRKVAFEIYPSAKALVKMTDDGLNMFNFNDVTIHRDKVNPPLTLCPNDHKIAMHIYHYPFVTSQLEKGYQLALDFDAYDKGELYNDEAGLTTAERDAVKDRMMCIYDALGDQSQCRPFTVYSHCFE